MDRNRAPDAKLVMDMAGSGVKKYIISSDERFEEDFGHRADKRRKLYNGMLKCNLYMYFKG